jgi:hypothetical protein
VYWDYWGNVPGYGSKELSYPQMKLSLISKKGLLFPCRYQAVNIPLYLVVGSNYTLDNGVGTYRRV